MTRKLKGVTESVERKRNQSLNYSDSRKTVNGKLYFNIAHAVDTNTTRLSSDDVKNLTSVSMSPIYKFCNSRVKSRNTDSKTLVPFNNALIGIVEQVHGKDSTYLESDGQSIVFSGVLATPEVLATVDEWFEMLVKFARLQKA
jgi:hypothetical protein